MVSDLIWDKSHPHSALATINYTLAIIVTLGIKQLQRLQSRRCIFCVWHQLHYIFFSVWLVKHKVNDESQPEYEVQWFLCGKAKINHLWIATNLKASETWWIGVLLRWRILRLRNLSSKRSKSFNQVRPCIAYYICF